MFKSCLYIFGKHIHNFILLNLKPSNFLINSFYNLYSAFKVIGINHFLQKELWHAYTAFVLNLFRIKIKLDRISAYTVPHSIIFYCTFYKLNPWYSLLLLYRVIIRILKWLSLILHLIKDIISHFPAFFLSKLHIKVVPYYVIKELLILLVCNFLFLEVIFLNKKTQNSHHDISHIKCFISALLKLGKWSINKLEKRIIFLKIKHSFSVLCYYLSNHILRHMYTSSYHYAILHMSDLFNINM